MDQFAGFLGLTSRGVIAIHTDWPAYPREHGWAAALLTFGDFPIGTKFRCIDNIDQCALFLAVGTGGEKDPYDENALHIAVWHEDLIELDRMDLIWGLEFDTDSDLTPEQRELRRQLGPELFEEVRSGRVRLGAHLNGEWIPLPPDAGDGEGYLEFGADVRTPDRLLLYDGTEVSLVQSADEKLAELAHHALEIPPTIQSRISPLLAEGLFDTCVRELGAAMETRMKEVLPASHKPLFGMRLVKLYVDALRESDRIISSRLKTLNQELRTAIMFVRNEFAHNLVDLPPGRGYTVVARMCWNLSVIEQANQVVARIDP